MLKNINGRKIYSRLIMTVLITMLLAGSVLAAGAQAENPKYIFFLIGDGMASSQATLAEYYNQFENLDEVNHSYDQYGESFIDLQAENHSDRLMMHRLDHEGSTRTTG